MSSKSNNSQKYQELGQEGVLVCCCAEFFFLFFSFSFPLETTRKKRAEHTKKGRVTTQEIRQNRRWRRENKRKRMKNKNKIK